MKQAAKIVKGEKQSEHCARLESRIKILVRSKIILEYSISFFLKIPEQLISAYFFTQSLGLRQSTQNSRVLRTQDSAMQISSLSFPRSLSECVRAWFLRRELMTLYVQKHSFLRLTSMSLNLAAIMRQLTSTMKRSQLIQHLRWKNLAAICRAMVGMVYPYLNSRDRSMINCVFPLAMANCTSGESPYEEFSFFCVDSTVTSWSILLLLCSWPILAANITMNQIQLLYDWLLPLLHLGWLALPLPLFYLLKRNYLDYNEKYLLILMASQLTGLMLPGIYTQIMRILVNTAFCIVLIDLCVMELEEYAGRFDLRVCSINQRKSKSESKRGSSNSEKNNLEERMLEMPKYGNTEYPRREFKDIKETILLSHFKVFQKLKIDETFIVPLATFAWIALHAYFSKSYNFGKGKATLSDGSTFMGFAETLDGWNCCFQEFFCFPIIWLSLVLFCLWMLKRMITDRSQTMSENSIIRTETEWCEQNTYKLYLLTYLIQPSLVLFGIDLLFNMAVHFSVNGMLECYDYFKSLFVLQYLLQWGLPLVIGNFFYAKMGKFVVRSERSETSEKSEENEMKKIQNVELDGKMNVERVQSFSFGNV